MGPRRGRKHRETATDRLRDKNPATPESLKMHSNNVRVVVRTRPTRGPSQEFLWIDKDTASLDIRLPNRPEKFHFKFDKILHDASQETVFDECMPPLIYGALEGYNGTVMAYGQVSTQGSIHTCST